LRIKEQETLLTLQEHDDVDDKNLGATLHITLIVHGVSKHPIKFRNVGYDNSPRTRGIASGGERANCVVDTGGTAHSLAKQTL